MEDLLEVKSYIPKVHSELKSNGKSMHRYQNHIGNNIGSKECFQKKKEENRRSITISNLLGYSNI